MTRTNQLDRDVLQAALDGFNAQRQRIDEQIARLRAQLGRNDKRSIPAEPDPPAEAPARKRRMSASGRKAIADAARKRWAAFRKKKRQVAEEPEAKAKPSGKQAAGRKAGPKARRGRKVPAKAARTAKRAPVKAQSLKETAPEAAPSATVESREPEMAAAAVAGE